MSNYLNHLVTRSLNPMETSVQPRLPSLFEPVAGVPGLGIAGSVEPEGIAVSETTQFREATALQRPTHAEDIQSVARRSPPPSSLEQYPLQSRPTSEVHELRFVPPIQTSPDLPVTPQSPIPDPRLDRPSSAAQAFDPPRQDRFESGNPVPKPAKTIDSVEQKPAIVQQTIIQRVVEQLFSPQPGDLDPSKVPATATERQEDRLAAIAPNLPTTNESPMPGTIPVRYSPTEIVKPQITPLIQTLQIPAVASVEASQPTPTIQVTIGRIEVRATPAPAPASSQARPKSPVMSLDEYLCQRGGKR